MVQIVQIEIVQIDKVGLGLLAIPSKTKGSKASSRIRATTGTVLYLVRCWECRDKTQGYHGDNTSSAVFMELKNAGQGPSII